jgi:DNA-binding transcriptional MerR regulator
MPDDRYSLTDLARLADVTPRTVRYYVAQGLLPSPEAAGPATRYGEGHLARLRLIRRLQREHLPLAEIRVRLERRGDDEIQALLDAADDATPQPPIGTDATLAYVRELMTRAGVAPIFYDQPADEDEDSGGQGAGHRPIPDGFPLRGPSGGAPPAAPMPAPRAVPAHPALPVAVPSPSGPEPRSTTGDRTTWERLVISPDVELHVRRPLDRATNKRVDRLERIARELFDEDA